MPVRETDKPIIITFGGGINARRRPMDIDVNECTEGGNFDLYPELLTYRKRSAFDLVATTPNAGDVRGWAQRVSNAGAVSTVIQSGAVVYTWDHATTFATVGVVAATAQLRGPVEQNFTLSQYVIVTDLNQQSTVKTWDGTTFANLAHNLSATDFYAKYCRIFRERAWFANVKSGTATPHMIVGSKLSDPTVLSISDRPATTLVKSDPCYMLTPDLRPVNGFEEGFGTFIVSSQRGRLFQIAGISSFDFDIQPFYTGSSVSGAEAMTNVGNDIALGLSGRIESLSGTINFGDVESDDLSLPIANLLETITEWMIAYDRKKRILFCFPSGKAAVYVFYKKLVDAQLRVSPWAKWTTGHQVNFQPTTVMPMVHPTTKEELVYMGDTLGNIYLLNGTGGRDGGTDDVTATRTTGLLRGLPEGNIFDLEGYILYHKQFAATVTLTFEYAGETIFDKAITIQLPAGDTIDTYSGSGSDARYYAAAAVSGSAYYGRQFSGRIYRQRFGPPGLSGYFQLRVDVTSQGTVSIHEIGIKFRTAET